MAAANIVPNAGTQVNDCITIATLKDLDGVKDDVYPKTYANNLKRIHDYNKEDILLKLKSHENNDVRKELRQHLLTLLTQSDTFSTEYSKKTPIKRRDITLMCQDIFNLGYCIIHNTPTKDLDEMFKNGSTEPAETEDVSNTSDAIIMMVEMNKKMDDMRKDHEEFKAKMLRENTDLRKEIESLKTKCAQNHQNMSGQVEVSGTPPDTQAEVQESDEPSTQITNELVEPTQSPEQNSTHNPEGLEGSENSEPPVSAIRPITAAPKLTDIFIVGVNPNNSPADIQAYISSKTDICIELRNIQEITISRRDKKAFKVTIPQSKYQEATSIWPIGVRAERFVKSRQRNMHPTQGNTPRTGNGQHTRNMQPTQRNTPRTRNGHNSHNRNRRNSGSNNNNNGHINNRNNRTQNRRHINNRHNGGYQSNGSNRQQPFQERGQNNYGSHSNGQRLHPSENAGFTQIPNPLWSLFRASGLLNQPFINI